MEHNGKETKYDKGVCGIERDRTRWVAKTGILAAIAVALMYLEFSLPLVPGFLKFDFSEIVVLLASFSLGPWTGILVELIKNLLHLPATHTMGTGELANFVIGSAFVGTAGFIYRHYKSKKSALLGMLAGTLVMTLLASVINYWLMIPFYLQVMGFSQEAIIGMVHAAGNHLVDDLKTLIVFVFIPFNLFKGLVISWIVSLVYKRLSPLLHC